MFFAVVALVAVSVFYLPSPVFSDVPQILNYQGKLTNTSGTLVTNGLYKMVFNLYAAASGGTTLWTETWDGASKVQVTNGLFNVLLGSVNTDTLGSIFQSNDNLYMGITVGTDSEMSPRQHVASVGYAIRSSSYNPVGTIQMYSGTSAPSGWLMCDGAAVSRTTYSRLFSIDGTTYGTGDGSTTFNVPDLRGIFPRGAGTNGSMTMANGAYFTGGSLGGKTTDTLQGHGHNTGNPAQALCLGSGAAMATYSTGTVLSLGYSNVTSPMEFGYGVPRTGAESKPASLSINFLIKF